MKNCLFNVYALKVGCVIRFCGFNEKKKYKSHCKILITNKIIRYSHGDGTDKRSKNVSPDRKDNYVKKLLRNHCNFFGTYHGEIDYTLRRAYRLPLNRALN